MENEEYAEAVSLAEIVLQNIKTQFGDKSSQTAVSLSNLGEMQRRAELHEDAGLSFLNSIELFRELEGETTPSAILPLVGLGASYHGLGDYTQAVNVLEEARAINRRNFGLLNEDQITILDHLANSLIRMERYEDAERNKLTGLDIMERLHGDSLELLPAIYKHARWLRGSNRFEEARNYYVQALRLIRKVDGSNSALLAESYRAIGNSYRDQKLPEGRGISALRRGLEILRSQEHPNKLEISRMLRNIGDWHAAFSTVGPTGNEYREAWALLDELEDGEALQYRFFYEPSYVLNINPSTRGLADPSHPDAVDGYVLVSFDITPAGKATNIAVVESVPQGFKDEATVLSISRSRFRPRLLEGEPVTAKGVTRRYTFQYIPLSKQN